MGSPVGAVCMISRTASIVSRRCGAGRPYSTPCHVSLSRLTPAPRPRRNRPPDISSTSSAVTARMKGLRVNAQAMPVPTPIRSVAAAIQVAWVTELRKSSGVQMQSIPAASAALACSARSEAVSAIAAIEMRSRADPGIGRAPYPPGASEGGRRHPSLHDRCDRLSAAAVATALGQSVVVGELVRLRERVATLSLVGEQARVLLGLVERGLRRVDDRLDLVLVAGGRRKGVESVDLLLDARDHGVGDELLLCGLTGRLVAREDLLGLGVDLLAALGADRVALRDELALGKRSALSPAGPAGPAGARRRGRGSASTPCQDQPCDQPHQGHNDSYSHLVFLL